MATNNNDPEYNEYDDDDYNYYPEYNEYGYPANSKKFDIDWSAWEKWLKKAIEEIVQEDSNTWLVKPSKKFPVSDASNGTSKEQFFMYLGSNHYDEAIWKKKHFVVDKLNLEYTNHIQSQASYFLQMPSYYKGLLDILN